MYELGVVYRHIVRADREAADALARYGSATVHEAMGRVGLLQPHMRPIYPGAQVSGTAVTVLLQPEHAEQAEKTPPDLRRVQQGAYTAQEETQSAEDDAGDVQMLECEIEHGPFNVSVAR